MKLLFRVSWSENIDVTESTHDCIGFIYKVTYSIPFTPSVNYSIIHNLDSEPLHSWSRERDSDRHMTKTPKPTPTVIKTFR